MQRPLDLFFHFQVVNLYFLVLVIGVVCRRFFGLVVWNDYFSLAFSSDSFVTCGFPSSRVFILSFH